MSAKYIRIDAHLITQVRNVLHGNGIPCTIAKEDEVGDNRELMRLLNIANTRANTATSRADNLEKRLDIANETIADINKRTCDNCRADNELRRENRELMVQKEKLARTNKDLEKERYQLQQQLDTARKCNHSLAKELAEGNSNELQKLRKQVQQQTERAQDEIAKNTPLRQEVARIKEKIMQCESCAEVKRLDRINTNLKYEVEMHQKHIRTLKNELQNARAFERAFNKGVQELEAQWGITI